MGIPLSVLQEPGTLFGRVLECYGCRLVCPGCPVEDDVYLDVFVSWLLGRLFIFLCGILLCFFFLCKLGLASPYIKQFIIFLIFSPHRLNYH